MYSTGLLKDCRNILYMFLLSMWYHCYCKDYFYKVPWKDIQKKCEWLGSIDKPLVTKYFCPLKLNACCACPIRPNVFTKYKRRQKRKQQSNDRVSLSVWSMYIHLQRKQLDLWHQLYIPNWASITCISRNQFYLKVFKTALV